MTNDQLTEKKAYISCEDIGCSKIRYRMGQKDLHRCSGIQFLYATEDCCSKIWTRFASLYVATDRPYLRMSQYRPATSSSIELVRSLCNCPLSLRSNIYAQALLYRYRCSDKRADLVEDGERTQRLYLDQINPNKHIDL
jgi:hypothetical protein